MADESLKKQQDLMEPNEAVKQQPSVPVVIEPAKSKKFFGIFDKTSNWKFSLGVMCVIVFVENFVISGSATVVLSTLEKEFFLTSTQSGFFLGIYELAGVVAAPVFGFIASFRSVNKLRLINVSLLLIAIGSLLIGFLVFAKEPYLDFFDDSAEASVNSSSRLCKFASDNDNRRYLRFDNDDTMSANCPSTTESRAKSASSFRFEYLLYLGHLIIGLGSVVPYSNGISYLEDISPPAYSALAQAIYYGAGSVGGGIGFLITGQLLSVNARFYMGSEYPPNDWITIDHPFWIGAWWLPYAFYGMFCTFLFIFVYAFSFCSYDTNLKTPTISSSRPTSSRQKEEEKGELESPSTLKKFLKASKEILAKFWSKFKRVIKNVQFIFIILSTITEGIILKGFLGFMAKYIEYQFQMPASEATVALGVVALLSVIAGTLISARIIKRYDLNAKQCALFTLAIFVITPFLFLALLNHCPETQFANANANAAANNNDLTSLSCSNCTCTNMFNPVCFDRQLLVDKSPSTNVYQSACHAGCHRQQALNNFTQCLCLDRNSLIPSVQTSGELLVLSSEFCDRSIQCIDKVIFNGVFAFLIVMLTAMSIIPHLKAALGTIGDQSLQTLALGVRAAFVNLFGNFIGTVLVGRVVDLSCKFWQTDCFDSRVCRLYNNSDMSLSLALVGFVCRALSALFMAVVCVKFFLDERKSNKLASKSSTPSSASPSSPPPPPSNDIELNENVMEF